MKISFILKVRLIALTYLIIMSVPALSAPLLCRQLFNPDQNLNSVSTNLGSDPVLNFADREPRFRQSLVDNKLAPARALIASKDYDVRKVIFAITQVLPAYTERFSSDVMINGQKSSASLTFEMFKKPGPRDRRYFMNFGEAANARSRIEADGESLQISILSRKDDQFNRSEPTNDLVTGANAEFIVATGGIGERANNGDKFLNNLNRVEKFNIERHGNEQVLSVLVRFTSTKMNGLERYYRYYSLKVAIDENGDVSWFRTQQGDSLLTYLFWNTQTYWPLKDAFRPTKW